MCMTCHQIISRVESFAHLDLALRPHYVIDLIFAEERHSPLHPLFQGLRLAWPEPAEHGRLVFETAIGVLDKPAAVLNNPN